METYQVKTFLPRGVAEISVPASKSIMGRALLLAAFSNADVRIQCGALCEDTRAFCDCLSSLGIQIEPTPKGLLVRGRMHTKKATLDVRSAGTAARFLPVMLAFQGGEYTFYASEQMKKRPMGVLDQLAKQGVKFEFFEEQGHFPFRMHSEGIQTCDLAVNTDESTQYASALLMAAGCCGGTVRLEGNRKNSSYIAMTLDVMRDFNLKAERNGDDITFLPKEAPPAVYSVEPDLSGACYFFALALLCRTKIFVRQAKLNTCQGDIQFVKLLEKRGLQLTETKEGVLADGIGAESFEGFNETFTDFSDQTLTAAALAPFASTPSQLKGVAHIIRQESNRINSVIENLTALGVPARTDGKDIFIEPAPVRPAVLDSFGDHRVAMAFALVGLKAGGVAIKNPDCCKKTFENYFEIIDELTK